MRALALAATFAISLSGCFIMTKKPSSSSQAVTSEPKNHGQERSEEVHERNAEKKAEHDEAKGKK